MLQREILFEPRANKKLPAAASKRLLNDVAGVFGFANADGIVSKLAKSELCLFSACTQ